MYRLIARLDVFRPRTLPEQDKLATATVHVRGVP